MGDVRIIYKRELSGGFGTTTASGNSPCAGNAAGGR